MKVGGVRYPTTWYAAETTIALVMDGQIFKLDVELLCAAKAL